MNSLSYLEWNLKADGSLLHGNPGVYVDHPLNLGVVFQQAVSTPVELYLSSTAGQAVNAFTIVNLKFFLTGNADTVAMLQSWAPLAGLQISFDSASTWTTFSTTVGNQQDHTSWLLMPGTAVSKLGVDGTLNNNDIASIAFRLVIPIKPQKFGISEFGIGVDFDVL